MRKEFIKESIEHYRELISDYNKMIADNKRRMVKPGISQSKRNAFKTLVEVSEKEKRECEQAIERLLNE